MATNPTLVKNITFINTATVDEYILRDTDDIINVITETKPLTIIFPNIQENKLFASSREIAINDISGHASLNKIFIKGTSGDTFNGHSKVYIDQPFGSCFVQVSGPQQYIVTFGTSESPNANLSIENTCIVTKNGNDDTGVLNSWSKPFLTIKAANDALIAAEKNATIYIFPGDYDEGEYAWCLPENKYVLENANILNQDFFIDDTDSEGEFTIQGMGTIQTFGIKNIKEETIINIDVTNLICSHTETLLTINGRLDINCKWLICSAEVQTETYAIVVEGVGSANINCQKINFANFAPFYFNSNNDINLMSDMLEIENEDTGAIPSLINGYGKSNINFRCNNIIANTSADDVFLFDGENQVNFENCSIASISNQNIFTTSNNGRLNFKNCILFSENDILLTAENSVSFINCQFNFKFLNYRTVTKIFIQNSVFIETTAGGAFFYVKDVISINLILSNSCFSVASPLFIEKEAAEPITYKVFVNCSSNKPNGADITNEIIGTSLNVDANAIL